MKNPTETFNDKMKLAHKTNFNKSILLRLNWSLNDCRFTLFWKPADMWQ